MRTLCILSLVVVTGCASQQHLQPWSEVRGVAEPKTLRHLVQGDVTGFTEAQGSQAWLGLPYAAPPVGALRWKATRPALPWQGVHEATKYGPRCPQLNGPLAASKDDGDVTGSEDCLTLNVYAPAFPAEQVAAERRPVMVWIHGGGNTIGTANVYGFARNLAINHGVIVVNVNYRLGVFGWFHHASLVGADATPEDASGNFGTLDLIQALKWVKANAAAFGGDPGNVTVFGESAGGFNVFSLLVSPQAKGLFHRAAIQSGMPGTYTMAEAANFTDDAEPGAAGSSGEILLTQLVLDKKATDRADAKRVLAAMKPDEVASYLRGKSPEALLAPFKGPGFGMYRVPAVLRDGHVIPAELLTEALSRTRNVPVLLGTNHDEFKLFMLGNPKYVSRFLGAHVKDDVVFERDARLVADLWKAIGTDRPADALRKQGGTPVFAYRFDWAEEPRYFFADLKKLLGASHGLEVGFVFDDEKSEFDPFGIYTKDNEAGRVKLSRAMASYWVQFARTGNPGRGVDGALPEWSEYGDIERFLVLDTDAGGGVRMEHGNQTLDGLETRLWGDKSFASDAERCESEKQLFKGFAGPSGAWTAERAAKHALRCPMTH